MGIGVVILDGGKRKELGEYLGIGTNNIAELIAIERGLDGGRRAGDRAAATAAIRVYTDSSYAIGLLAKGWKAKANQELVARLRKRVASDAQRRVRQGRRPRRRPRERALRRAGDERDLTPAR